MASEAYEQESLFREEVVGKKEQRKPAPKLMRETTTSKNVADRLHTPLFAEQTRSLSCLEVDFPLVPVNRLARQEGNAGKPVYQMSKWWARRRSSVFRSMLLAAAIKAPERAESGLAAQQVWQAYYENHQQTGSFTHLRVLDPFMGGGTTLVEGARLGMQMYGVDLNPVAWLVVKNELSGSDPEQVQALFQVLESVVKPQVQPFYTTDCPRGHHGQWIDTRTNLPADVEPLKLRPQEREFYRWQGPEVIYTFWAKHATCPATGCGHRTPIFKTLVIAEKKLTTNYLALHCTACNLDFDAEMGTTRMAPAAQRVVLSSEKPFTEMAQDLALQFANYEKGTRQERDARLLALLELLPGEKALCCPRCGAFAAQALLNTMKKYAHPGSKVAMKKKDLHIQRKTVFMQLLIHPDWLKGTPKSLDGRLLGGYAGADPEATAIWYHERSHDLSLIEVRGQAGQVLLTSVPSDEDKGEDGTGKTAELAEAEDGLKVASGTLVLSDGKSFDPNQGTVPAQSTCTCGFCGRRNDLLTAVKASGQTAPTMAYTLQGYCPTCEAEGYNYGGRFFKAPDAADLACITTADAEWARRSEDDLRGFWPLEKLPYAHMTHHLNGGIPNWGYTHWWKMFNSRQLLIHASLLHAITTADPAIWPLNVREQALGAFQQYLRNQNMFCFWDMGYDKLVPSLSNNHFHPKQLIVENCVFHEFGRGNWKSTTDKVIEGIEWQQDPWESSFKNGSETATAKVYPGDSIRQGQASVYCGSSTELPLEAESMDLVITDPPFGDNIFYADLADFFYVWLRIPLLCWYEGQPEAAYFQTSATPKALEAITNRAEHPDTRSEEEKKDISSRPPADEFYRQALTACWLEAYRVLKLGGMLAFTFHHSADEPWINVLESLFEAGFILVATYPIRSDESKGEHAQFGSKKIEYDIIHVCRKRLDEPQEIPWVHIRREMIKEVFHLARVLETYHGEDLSKADMRVILRGKALEYYSRSYGQVMTTDREPFSIRDALIGINLILDEMLEKNDGPRPPDISNEITRRFLRIFGSGQSVMARDELHKSLRGTAVTSAEFLDPGWLSEGLNKTVHVPTIQERFKDLRKQIGKRDTIKTDLDQAHFFIGAALPSSGVDITRILQEGNILLHHDVEVLLVWYARESSDETVRQAASLAERLLTSWRVKGVRKEEKKSDIQQFELFE